MWDTRYASKVDVLVGSFSLSVLLNVNGKGCWWMTGVYGPNCPR